MSSLNWTVLNGLVVSVQPYLAYVKLTGGIQSALPGIYNSDWWYLSSLAWPILY